MKNRKLGNSKMVAKYCRSQIRGSRKYLGEYLTGNNLLKVRSAQTLWLAIIADFVSRRQTLRTFTLVNVVSELNACDVKAWLAACDKADDLLLQSTNDAKGPSLGWWETTLSSTAGKADALVQSLLRLLRRELRAWFVDEDVTAFRTLHQIFGFPLRLSLELDDLRDTALASWIDAERSSQAMPGDRDPERAIISEWFPKVKQKDALKHFEPHHGPGSVWEFDARTCSEQKTLACKYLMLEMNAFQRDMIYSLNLEQNIGHGMMQSAFPQSTYDTWGPRPQGFFSFEVCHEGERAPVTEWMCEVVFVSKSWKTYRTISKEHCTTMWLQQGVREAIDYVIKTNQTGLARYYNPTDSASSQELCCEGSIDGFYATIDLSAASDSVSWALVQDWFADSWLSELLYAVRTPYAYEASTGSIYLQSKFAPMGSAVCFPTLSTVMAAICESARREYFRLHNLNSDKEYTSWPWFRVFGDDIICRAEIAEMVIVRLTELGFKVNKRKSYYRTDSKHFFRECCGVEYLDGQDVSIVKLPRPNFEGFIRSGSSSRPYWNPTPMELKKIPGLVGLTNNLFKAGLKVARLVLITHLLSESSLPLVFSQDAEVGILTSSADNRHLDHVYVDRFQRGFIRGMKIITLPKGTTKTNQLVFCSQVGYHVLRTVELSKYDLNGDTWEFRANSNEASYSDWTGSSRLYEWLRTHRCRTGANVLDVCESTQSMDYESVSYIWQGLVDPELLGGPVDPWIYSYPWAEPVRTLG